MRKPKSGFASVYLKLDNGKEMILVIGGNDGQVQNRVEYLNLGDMQWHKCASMLSRRDELAAVVGPDNKVYAIGGYGGSSNASCLNTVERYDPINNKWEAVAQMI
jgi:N-acetylneuraminic acid mutarotase